jgi:hypothetical protein
MSSKQVLLKGDRQASDYLSVEMSATPRRDLRMPRVTSETACPSSNLKRSAYKECLIESIALLDCSLHDLIARKAGHYPKLDTWDDCFISFRLCISLKGFPMARSSSLLVLARHLDWMMPYIKIYIN